MNGRPVVELSGPLAIAVSAKVQAKIAADFPDGSVEAVDALAVFARSADAGGVPATIQHSGEQREVPDRAGPNDITGANGVSARRRTRDDSRHLVLYGPRLCCGLYPDPEGRGYRLGFIRRRDLTDHRRLAEGAMLLRGPADWQIYEKVADFPQGATRPYSHWNQLAHAWASATRAAAPDQASAAQTRFLELVTTVVETTHTLETEAERADRAVAYRKRRIGGEQRHSAGSVYVFDVVGDRSWLRPEAMAAVADVAGGLGQVVRQAGTEVTVRFKKPLKHQSVPRSGSLVPVASDHSFRAQERAIERLRSGRAADPSLLSHLVDGCSSSYRPDTDARPIAPLSDGQLDAFQRAMTVPDQLLVLGPPGTGKTTMIREIVSACVSRSLKVLVTSHTNRAVDNVIDRLPEHLLVVRVGNEDSLTDAGRRHLIGNQSDRLRSAILAATEPLALCLAAFTSDGPVVQQCLDLEDLLAERDEADAELAQLEEAEATMLATVDSALASRLETVVAAEEGMRHKLNDAWEQLRSAAESADEAASLTEGPAQMFRVPLVFWRERVEARRAARVDDAVADLSRAEAARMETAAAAQSVLAASPEVDKVRDARKRVTRQRSAIAARIENTAGAIRAAVDRLPPVATALPSPLPTPDSNGNSAADQSGVGDDHDQNDHDQADPRRLPVTADLVRRRAQVLTDWRRSVDGDGGRLHGELVDQADVVAATCIGTATSPLLRDLDFDMVIVDEAGQVSLPTLLVPLVTGRRAVLVGDHEQLPPFVDESVARWARSLDTSPDHTPDDAADLHDLVFQSGFERLQHLADDGHRVMLDVQRRMPAVIAEFVSRQFYHGQLRSDPPDTAPPPIFDRRFVLVDSTNRANRIAHERRAGRADGAEGGYINEVEAEAITRMVAAAAASCRSWAVIVPYRAQVRRLVELLSRELGHRVAENVGTVDSFQGGERDLVIYGFTRSNPSGDIGFLRELRRLNVAMTRARRQLILVGDLATLTRAPDRPFAGMVRSLAQQLRRQRAVIAVEHLGDHLGERPEKRPGEQPGESSGERLRAERASL